MGYTSGNDRTVLTVMRGIGMVSSNSEPTSLFDAFRNKDRAEIAAGIRKAYADLFSLYPDAHKKDDEALRNFFRSKTTAGSRVQQQLVRTFKTLAEFGDFDSTPSISPSVAPPSDARKETTETAKRVQTVERVASQNGLTLNVNIQLQLPPSADGEVYDKLFQAMGKHLKGLASLE